MMNKAQNIGDVLKGSTGFWQVRRLLTSNGWLFILSNCPNLDEDEKIIAVCREEWLYPNQPIPEIIHNALIMGWGSDE